MILAVIPARWASTRFPGKPLALIGDKPMVWHVYQRCFEAECFDRIVVATDDRRIEEACKRLKLDVVMTKTCHPTGTDRVAEVAAGNPADLYVNVQGDEPFVAREALEAVVDAAQRELMPVNACAKITDPADFVDVTVPKVVVKADWTALYLSRSPVPYPKIRSWWACYQQVCVYGFDRVDLEWFVRQPQGPVEQSEGIELLRFLEHGRDVRMVEVPASPVAVDTMADLERAREILRPPVVVRDIFDCEQRQEFFDSPSPKPRIIPNAG